MVTRSRILWFAQASVGLAGFLGKILVALKNYFLQFSLILGTGIYRQRWAVSRYLYRRYVSRDTFVSISVSIKCFIAVSRIGIDSACFCAWPMQVSRYCF